MALTFFETIGVSGQTLKFLADSNTNGELALVVSSNIQYSLNRQLTPTNNAVVIQSVAANLTAFKVENLSLTSQRFLIFFNQTAVPTSGQTTNIIDVFSINPATVLAFGSDYFGTMGIRFSSGIVAALSTSRSNYTNSGTNEMDLSVVSYISP